MKPPRSVRVASVSLRTKQAFFGIVVVPLFTVCMVLLSADGMLMETMLDGVGLTSDNDLVFVLLLVPCGLGAIGLMFLPVHVALVMQEKLGVEFF